MIFIDIENGRRYAGRLEQEDDPDGFTADVLVLTGRGKERRLGCRDPFQYQLYLLGGTLDDVARLDRAGFCIDPAPPELTRRRGRRPS